MLEQSDHRHPGGGVTGPQRQRLTQLNHRLIQFVALQQQSAKTMVSLDGSGIESDSKVKRGLRFHEASGLVVLRRNGNGAFGLCIARITRNRAMSAKFAGGAPFFPVHDGILVRQKARR